MKLIAPTHPPVSVASLAVIAMFREQSMLIACPWLSRTCTRVIVPPAVCLIWIAFDWLDAQVWVGSFHGGVHHEQGCPGVVGGECDRLNRPAFAIPSTSTSCIWKPSMWKQRMP